MALLTKVTLLGRFGSLRSWRRSSVPSGMSSGFAQSTTLQSALLVLLLTTVML